MDPDESQLSHPGGSPGCGDVYGYIPTSIEKGLLEDLGSFPSSDEASYTHGAPAVALHRPGFKLLLWP